MKARKFFSNLKFFLSNSKINNRNTGADEDIEPKPMPNSNSKSLGAVKKNQKRTINGVNTPVAEH